jgi:hypothetical protein
MKPAKMSTRQKHTAAKLRSWRVSILRARPHLLGFVEAADQQSAEKAAVKIFDLDEEQRRRLIVQEIAF